MYKAMDRAINPLDRDQSCQTCTNRNLNILFYPNRLSVGIGSGGGGGGALVVGFSFYPPLFCVGFFNVHHQWPLTPKDVFPKRM